MDLMTTCSLIGKTLTPMAEDMTLSYVTAVVITGLTVVFLGLIILILFVWAFGKIFSRKKKPAVQEKPVETAKPAAAPVSIPKTDDNQDEIIAVISAAVAAMGASDGKTYKLRSVRTVKISRRDPHGRLRVFRMTQTHSEINSKLRKDNIT